MPSCVGRMTARLAALFAGVLLLASACAVHNEGAVDLRRTLAPKAAPGEKPTSFADLKAKNFSQCMSDSDAACQRDVQISEGDSVSVHLRSALIHWFFEILPAPLKGFRHNGEIAIVANAFETGKGRELDFKDLKAGRLVFYSDDVEKGQFLNFNNLPVYGPIKYEGGPLAVRFVGFELDTSSEQARAVFTVLSQFGAIAYPPAAPALGLLNSLGSAFATSDTNDIIFRYDMVLDAKQGSPRVSQFVLEAGNYVLLRSHNRQQPIDWDKLELDENEGRLYWKEGDSRRRYTEGTYLVFSINKNVGTRDIELAQNTFKDLLEALAQEDKARAGRITTALGPMLQSALQERGRIDNFGSAKDILQSIRARGDAPTDAALLSHNREDARAMLKMIADSVDANGEWREHDGATPPVASPLSASGVKYVLERLRDIVHRRGKLAGNEATLERKTIKAASPGFTAQLDLLTK